MDFFIGIDVSKRTLDLNVLGDGGRQICEFHIQNEVKALQAVLVALKTKWSIDLTQLVVCMEHTGIYNAVALGVFWKKNIRVCVERAMHIKLSQGLVRGKSDKLDARRIAQFAYRNRESLTFWKPERDVVQHMQALLTLRARLVVVRSQLTVPLSEMAGFMRPDILKDLKDKSAHSLRGIEKDLREVEKELRQLTTQDPLVKTQMEQITSIKGVGPITAMNVILATGEFKKITEAKKFACYAGVVPFEHSSGSSIRGKSRVSNLANSTIKKLLHLSAVSAITHNKELKAYYERKIATGKNKMSVINAVRNKLISRIFSCIKNNRTYKEEFQHALA
jgi:transposase